MYLYKRKMVEETIKRVEKLKEEIKEITKTVTSLRDDEYISNDKEDYRELTLGEEDKADYLFNCMDYASEYLDNAKIEVEHTIKELKKIM